MKFLFRRIMFFIVVIATLIGIGFGSYYYSTYEPVPETIQTLEGMEISGLPAVVPPDTGIVYLTYWSIDCAYCIQTLQELNKLKEHVDELNDLRGQELVSIIALNIGDRTDEVVELVEQLLNEGQMIINSEYQKILTYHDPCHLGRHVGMYKTPREVYNKIPGIKLVEMRRNRENAWCCGAGGGVKIGYPEWALEVSKERLEEAKETGATVVSSTCPFCRTNLSDANENYNFDMDVLDLMEIIDKLDIEIMD